MARTKSYRVEVAFTSSVIVKAASKAEARALVIDADPAMRFVSRSDYTVGSVTEAES